MFLSAGRPGGPVGSAGWEALWPRALRAPLQACGSLRFLGFPAPAMALTLPATTLALCCGTVRFTGRGCFLRFWFCLWRISDVQK